MLHFDIKSNLKPTLQMTAGEAKKLNFKPSIETCLCIFFVVVLFNVPLKGAEAQFQSVQLGRQISFKSYLQRFIGSKGNIFHFTMLLYLGHYAYIYCAWKVYATVPLAYMPIIACIL